MIKVGYKPSNAHIYMRIMKTYLGVETNLGLEANCVWKEIHGLNHIYLYLWTFIFILQTYIYTCETIVHKNYLPFYVTSIIVIYAILFQLQYLRTIVFLMFLEQYKFFMIFILSIPTLFICCVCLDANSCFCHKL